MAARGGPEYQGRGLAPAESASARSAAERTRTSTGLPPYGPEPYAYTNFATAAGEARTLASTLDSDVSTEPLDRVATVDSDLSDSDAITVRSRRIATVLEAQSVAHIGE